jgi:hypothetical protein
VKHCIPSCACGVSLGLASFTAAAATTSLISTSSSSTKTGFLTAPLPISQVNIALWSDSTFACGVSSPIKPNDDVTVVARGCWLVARLDGSPSLGWVPVRALPFFAGMGESSAMIGFLCLVFIRASVPCFTEAWAFWLNLVCRFDEVSLLKSIPVSAW